MLVAALLFSFLHPSPRVKLPAPSAVEAKVDSLIQRMTLEEKVSLCHGGSSFATAAIPRLGIPSYNFSDGPNGVRMPWDQPATYFPTGVSIASTWDPALAFRVGAAIGEETLAKGNSVILGPGVNIVRTPLGGRSFEYYSEDPYLAKRTAVSYIEGVQSKGVSACVKHFALNSIENERGTVSAEVDERTMREIYLPAFEGAVREAHVGSVMAAYNRINGVYCAENPHLLNDILKGDWGFQGFVMSDWGAVHSTAPSALNGMDLEMPGDRRNFMGAPLLAAVKAGQVPESVIDDHVRRFLRTMMSLEAAQPKTKPPLNSPEHQALAQRVAEEAMVLLKNDRGLLPLDKNKIHSIAVIGPNADTPEGMGGGSAQVHPPFEITPLQGIKSYLASTGVKMTYAPATPTGVPISSDELQTPDGQPGLKGEYFATDRPAGDPVLTRVDSKIDFDWASASPDPKIAGPSFSVRWTGFLVPKVSGKYYVGAGGGGWRLSVGDVRFGQNWADLSAKTVMEAIDVQAGVKYPITLVYFHDEGPAHLHLVGVEAGSGTPWIQQAVDAAKRAEAVVLVVGTTHSWDTEGRDKPSLSLAPGQDELAAEVLKANPNTIVVLVNGTAVEMPWIAQTHAVLEAWYGGMMAGNSIARILFGDVDPSGKLTVTFPVSLQDSPATANGDYPPKGGKLPYDEGVLVGYRYFDAKNVRPLFPFGYGLSYTKFGYSGLRVKAEPQGAYQVSFKLRNEGKFRGMETAEVYVRPKNHKVLRPMQELKGYAKVDLAPGASKTATVTLPASSFAYWSVGAKPGWTVDPGDYEIVVGASSRDIRLGQTVHVP